MIWIKLTRTNAVFSRITLGVYFCVEFNFLKKFQKIHQHYIFTEDSRNPKDIWRGATWLSGGDRRAPLAAPGGPLGDLDHLSGSPSVFRSLRPRNGESPKDFPKYVLTPETLVREIEVLVLAPCRDRDSRGDR